MAYGSGRKEDERYCYNCMAILPTRLYFQPYNDLDDPINIAPIGTPRICCKCLKEIKPPEETITEQE